MAEKPSHIKQLSLIHACKIGLKGPKLEIFGSRAFPQIRPAWVDDLGNRPENQMLMV